MTHVNVFPVESRSDMAYFVDLPWTIYQDNPNWIPPLKRDVHRLLDVRKHPFWAFSRQALFLARRGEQVVGRIAGIIDSNYNTQTGEKMAVWGFFECLDDEAAALALFSAVTDWANQNGMHFLRGPLNPSLHYGAGILINNFEYPPTLLLTYNPSYYKKLIEGAGFIKEKDLLSFWVDKNLRIPDWLTTLLARINEKADIQIRTADKKRFQSELELVLDLYNTSMFRNWGQVSMSLNEAKEMGKSLKRVIDLDLVFFIYYKDEPVGVGFALPDWNCVLKRLNGRVGLLGLFKILKYKNKINGLRGFMFGIKEEYHQLGFPVAAFNYMYRLLRQQTKYHYMELGWTLEDNDPINRLFFDGGLKVYKQYRIFRKAL